MLPRAALLAATVPVATVSYAASRLAPWKPTGPFSVGVTDISWLQDAHEEVDVKDIDPSKQLVARCFYPANPTTSGQLFPPLRSGVPWLPSPPSAYANGLVDFLAERLGSAGRGNVASGLRKRLANGVTRTLGTAQQLELYEGAPPAAPPGGSFPVILFSHGLGGQRAMYSIPCSELASQGYVVLAIEHADGSASMAQLAGGRGWRPYAGLGDSTEQEAKTRFRLAEMSTALRVLRALHAGTCGSSSSFQLSVSPLARGVEGNTLFRGLLDLNCLAAVGHSYGGATVTAWASQDPAVKLAIALDPYWAPLPSESPVKKGEWLTEAPLLVIGSHDWNKPNGWQVAAQDRVLEAAKRGGGAALLVIKGSSHNTFADPLALFSTHFSWILDRLKLPRRLDPVLGMHLVNCAMLHFLSAHLPINTAARGAQNWAPSNGTLETTDEGAVRRRIRERDEADAKRPGMLGAAVGSVSDAWWKWTHYRGQSSEKLATAHSADREDVITAEEFYEATMPTSPRAMDGEDGDVEKEGGLTGVNQFDGHRNATKVDVQNLGRWYKKLVSVDDSVEMEALLGRDHIYKLDVFSS